MTLYRTFAFFVTDVLDALNGMLLNHSPCPSLGHVVPPSVLRCRYSDTVPVADDPGAAVQVMSAPIYLLVLLSVLVPLLYETVDTLAALMGVSSEAKVMEPSDANLNLMSFTVTVTDTPVPL